MPIVSADYSDLNFDDMAASIGLKPKHMPMLIGSFLEEADPIISDIKNAIRSNDYSELRLKAHSIKGSAGNLKLNEIYEMAKEMEHAAAESKTDFDYDAYLDAISKAVETIPQ